MNACVAVYLVYYLCPHVHKVHIGILGPKQRTQKPICGRFCVQCTCRQSVQSAVPLSVQNIETDMIMA